MPPDEILYSPWILAVLGLCIGSFLNVVVHRLPLMLERGWKEESAELLGVALEKAPPVTLAKPRSRCPSCGHAIAWHENIPVASWLWLRGRCSACKTRISARYPLVELATGALFAAIGWRFGAQPTTLLWCGFAAVLLAAALIDFDTQLLPDILTQPLLWAGIIAAALRWIPVPLAASVGGAVVGYLSLWTVATLYRMIRGHEGMAAGDFKLLAALGAWMGWQMIPLIVLLSSAVGAVIGLAMIAFRNHDRQVPIPFGPYLAGGGLAAMFLGELLMRLWLPRA
jgi:leader peptidase (prepilin peptidase)/N-methyltransferase